MSYEHLDSCGCCEPTGRRTPAQVSNTPGQPAVERRVGTASSFAATMAADLTAQEALADFTNRRTDDPAIALVDAWSVVLDVLTFYSERLSNEGYLRTAVEPRSLTELAHSVGYTPGRGRAAATLLAFTLQDGVGVDGFHGKSSRQLCNFRSFCRNALSACSQPGVSSVGRGRRAGLTRYSQRTL